MLRSVEGPVGSGVVEAGLHPQLPVSPLRLHPLKVDRLDDFALEEELVDILLHLIQLRTCMLHNPPRTEEVDSPQGRTATVLVPRLGGVQAWCIWDANRPAGDSALQLSLRFH